MAGKIRPQRRPPTEHTPATTGKSSYWYIPSTIPRSQAAQVILILGGKFNQNQRLDSLTLLNTIQSRHRRTSTPSLRLPILPFAFWSSRPINLFKSLILFYRILVQMCASFTCPNRPPCMKIPVRFALSVFSKGRARLQDVGESRQSLSRP